MVTRQLRRLTAVCCMVAGVLAALLLAGCATPQPLNVYRAYQESATARGPYYLREAFVAAPDHALAMNLVAGTMSEIRPDWSGPIYISYVGVTDKNNEPGLLGGPVWLETSGDKPQKHIETAASTEAQMRESLSLGSPAKTEKNGWLPPISPRHPQ